MCPRSKYSIIDTFVLAIACNWKLLVRQVRAKLRHFRRSFRDTHYVSVASVVFELLNLLKKGCNPDPVNS